MSLECYVGPQGNLLEMKPDQLNRLLLKSPILTSSELLAIKNIQTVYPSWSVANIDITFENLKVSKDTLTPSIEFAKLHLKLLLMIIKSLF